MPDAIVGGIASVAGSLIGADAAGDAADTQAAAADRSAQLQYKMWQEQQALQKPWRDAGENALTRLTAGTQAGGEFVRPFRMSDYEEDPGYQFRLSEGLKSLDRTAAARGGLISGSALKAAQRFGQQTASDEFQNAFNRYQANRSNALNPLQSLAGIGQTSTNALGQAASQYGANVGNLITGAGAAQAAGQVGAANAWGSGISQGMSAYQNNQLMNRMFPQSGGGGYGTWQTSGSEVSGLPSYAVDPYGS